MTMRTSRKTVTFRRPFSLSGLDEMQPAGTYTVLVALTQPGTLNVIGTIREVPFTFTP